MNEKQEKPGKENYEKDVQKFLKALNNLDFPEISTLPGKHFTLSYTDKVLGYVMLGGKIENIAYNIRQHENSKRILGAMCELKISTNVTEHFASKGNWDKPGVDWQEGMHTLGFSNRYNITDRTHMAAYWEFIKPRTHTEVEEYWRLTHLEVKDKIAHFRSVMLIEKLEKGQVIFR